MTWRKEQAYALRETAVAEAQGIRIHRDNVGKVPPAAGAGSNLQRLHERGLGRSRGEPGGIDE